MKASDPPIVVEEVFDTSVQKVWSAITELDQMVKWFFTNIPEFKPKIGFETSFIVENEGRTFPHIWKITEVIPLRKITYDWSYQNYTGRGLVTFDLFPEDKHTKLRLTNLVTEDFQEGVPEFTRGNCIGGWQYFIKQNLKKYLDNQPRVD